MDREGATPHEHDSFQQERHPDGRDQGREPGCVSKRPVGHPLDRDVDSTHEQHGGGEGHQKRDKVGHAERVLTGAREKSHHRGRDICAQGEDVAMGEVDELDDPVDHRVAQGDEGVDRAQRQRVRELLWADERVEHREEDDARNGNASVPAESDRAGDAGTRCGGRGRHLAARPRAVVS